jgi:hypothetical protein
MRSAQVRHERSILSSHPKIKAAIFVLARTPVKVLEFQKIRTHHRAEGLATVRVVRRNCQQWTIGNECSQL